MHALITLLILLGTANATEETVTLPAEAEEVIYDQVSVVAELETLPGSAHVVGEEELERYQTTDLHRALARVPGISLQEEDGFGLRPNIGLRGTGVERSSKITLLEDGVLIAPAPYAAPSAYYSPTTGRMSAIEVRKGSAAIRQGPYTLGGAVNYVSTAIPADWRLEVDAVAGEYGSAQVHAHTGRSWANGGFLVETFQQQSDGFKDLDGGGDTGFTLSDYLVKARLHTDADAQIFQSLELKLGYTEQEGDETYLGLTTGDFDRTPYRRYAASQEDRIDTEHEQFQLTWLIQPRVDVDVTTVLYRNDFFRNWRKNESVLGVSNGSVLASPAVYADELAILRGDADSPDDALRVRNNRRDYYSQGIQTTLGWRFDVGGVAHELTAGIRYHEDEEDRFQEEDRFAMIDGRMVLTAFGAPGSQANRIGEAEALAFFLEDRIRLGRFIVTPGIRFEQIDTRRLDYGSDDPTRSGADLAVRENSAEVWIPGIGVTYEAREDLYLFGSVHRGFSPPGPSSREPVEPEESVNYEFGARWLGNDIGLGAGTRVEVVAFWNDYDNLLGRDTLSGGGTGTGDAFNGGEVEVRGLEVSFGTTLFAGNDFRIPFQLAYTYTEGEFQSSFETSFADWEPFVERGDALPYLPENQLFVELGLEHDRFDAYLSATWVDDVRTTSGQGPITADQRIDSHLVLDLAGGLDLTEAIRLTLQVRNLADETYVAARRPYGLRPGLPRTALVGLSLRY